MGIFRLILITGGIVASSASSFAHGLLMEWKITATQIIVTVQFDSDDPADDAEVRIQTADGEVIAKAMTNAKGEATFEKPAEGRYRLVADAGAGHVVRKDLVISSDLPQSQTIEESTSKLSRITLGLVVIGVLVLMWQLMARKRG